MKIGVFGGSFNPIHIGHCIVANHILQSSELDEVWLNVSPQNPLKEETSDAMSQHRLNMARLAIDGCDGLKVCDVEFHMPVPSYTISTLRELKRIYPEHDFKLIMAATIGLSSTDGEPSMKLSPILELSFTPGLDFLYLLTKHCPTTWR